MDDEALSVTDEEETVEWMDTSFKPDPLDLKIPRKRERKPEKEAKSATATKRLKGLLKVHGGTDAEIVEVVKKRTKAAKLEKAEPNEIARRVKANQKAEGEARLAKAKKVLAKGKASTVSRDKREGARKAKRKEAMGELTMKRSYQKEGGIATGTMIAGGARQTVCTFPEKLFGKIGARAKKEGTSFAEQIRRLTTQALGAK